MIKFKTLLLSASTLMVLAACGPTAEDAPVEEEPAIEEPAVETPADDVAEETSDISISELGVYDGQNGNPAYVAVDGVVYDVTDNEAWAGGEHVGEFPAGNDYTEEILSSPHGESVLENLPVVGNLVD